MGETLLRAERSGEVVILEFGVDYLDASNADAFRAEAAPLVADAMTVALDLSRLKFIDSSGLGGLLSILRRLNEKGGCFKVFAITEPVRFVFELVRLHKVLDIEESREAALASCRDGPEGDAGH